MMSMWRKCMAAVAGSMLAGLAVSAQDMPGKAEVTEGGKQTVMRFSNYNFATPDAALFAVPPGFRKYNSMMEMMMSGMQNLMPGAGR